MTEFTLPVLYSKTSSANRRLIREQYIKEQHGLCYWCNCNLTEQPPKDILDMKINWRLFPTGFLNAPIHLQHNHTAMQLCGNITIGNAWLVNKSVFNGASEPLLCPENGIVKIYGPSVHSAILTKCNITQRETF